MRQIRDLKRGRKGIRGSREMIFGSSRAAATTSQIPFAHGTPSSECPHVMASRGMIWRVRAAGFLPRCSQRVSYGQTELISDEPGIYIERNSLSLHEAGFFVSASCLPTCRAIPITVIIGLTPGAEGRRLESATKMLWVSKTFPLGSATPRR